MYPQNRDQIIEGLNRRNDTLSRMIEARDKSDEVDADILEVRVKAIKGIVMQVDNSLGELRDLLDTMEHYEDERHEETRRIVDQIEESTAELVNYLRTLGRY